MKSIVIDLNILMDFLFKRQEHESVAEIFAICSTGKIKGYICAHEITTLFYFLDKSVRDKIKIKKTISGLMKQFRVIEINDVLLNKALFSEIGDFEDAVIEASALEKKAEYILTRNTKDFRKSMINVITPSELLALIKATVV